MVSPESRHDGDGDFKFLGSHGPIGQKQLFSSLSHLVRQFVAGLCANYLVALA